MESYQLSAVFRGTWGIVLGGATTFIQRPFQDPKLEVPTIYKAYFSGLNFREYPHNSYGQKYGTVVQYLHVLDPEDLPLIHVHLPVGLHVAKNQFGHGMLYKWAF